jgi:hypothetical protein
MRDVKMATRPTMRWVPVVDGRGRRRMEARWSVPPESTAPSRAPHAA